MVQEKSVCPDHAKTGSEVMNANEQTIGSIPGSSHRTSGRVISIFTVALTVSVALNVALATKLRNLNYAQAGRVAEYRLKIGTTVPLLTARRLDGQQEVISYEGTNQPTVLYIFTPPCSWCARNVDNFKRLVDKESHEYRFIGLSLSEGGLAEYVAKNELKLPVYSGLSPETLKTYKLGSTPQTIVISPEGKVLQNWTGAYVGDQKSQVEAFFHVTLPGLRELPVEERSKATPATPGLN
jgi:peroxiredoxin